ncbi:MAG: 30S ribosomal protein S8 [Pseudobdellovibrionaceae bacterium]
MDKVAEFLTCIRNSGAARQEKVDVPSSNMRMGIAKALQDIGYIRSYKVAKDSKQGLMRIYLKYDEKGVHSITNIERISRSGRRRYVSCDEIPKVRSGLGSSILSTSKGIMSGAQAKTMNLGGELIAYIW